MRHNTIHNCPPKRITKINFKKKRTKIGRIKERLAQNNLKSYDSYQAYAGNQSRTEFYQAQIEFPKNLLTVLFMCKRTEQLR